MDTLIQFLISNAFMATAIALVVVAVGKMWHNPRLLHALWIVVLLKLVTPSLLTIPIEFAVAPHEVSLEHDAAETAPNLLLSASHDPDAVTMTPADSQHDRRIGAARSAGKSTTSWNSTFRWTTSTVVVWLIGVAMCVCITAYRVVRFSRLLAAARPAGREIDNQARELCRTIGLRSLPKIVLLEAHVSPFVWPFARRAVIVLPSELFRQLDASARRVILAHELVHVRRRDHWVRLLELTATALFYWCPVLWWARWRLRELEEQCIDFDIIERLPDLRRSYALALVDTVEYLTSARNALPVGATGVLSPSSLKARIATILTTPAVRSQSPFIQIGAASLLAMAALPLGFAAARHPAVDASVETEQPRDTSVAKEAAAQPVDGPMTVGVEGEIESPTKVEQTPLESAAKSSQPSEEQSDIAFSAETPVRQLKLGVRLAYGKRELEVQEIPDELKGRQYGVRGGYEGVARFRVRRPQTIYLAINAAEWGGGGNPSGDWQKELVTQRELESQGWRQTESLILKSKKQQEPTALLVFARDCQAGESFVIRNHKYHAPVVIWGERNLP